MRPLFHPAPEDITVEGVLHALCDPVRVHIFGEIARAKGAQTCSAFLVVGARPVPKSTLSQHFKALREAGLIRSERKGVEMHNTARCPEVDARFPGLLAAILGAHRLQSARAAQKKRRPARSRRG